MHIKFDIFRGLNYVDAVEHGEKPEEFKWLGETILYLGENEVRNGLRRSGDGKVVDLTYEEDWVSVDGAFIKARFMGCAGKLEGRSCEDAVDHGGPKAWGFGVTL